LREYAGALEVHTVGSGLPDTFQRLVAIQPQIILMDATDREIVEQTPLLKIWSELPSVTVIQLNWATEDVRVFHCDQLRTHGVEGLLEVMRTVAK
jgi:hypothetical protein